jgi:hypothetical protein
MVKFSIPKTYKIVQRGNNSAVARSPDDHLSLFFAKQPHGSSETEQKEFIERVMTELNGQVADLKPLELGQPSRLLNGFPMFQVAIAGKIAEREVKVGLFMLEMSECILFMMAIIDGANFKQKQLELRQIFASISDPK